MEAYRILAWRDGGVKQNVEHLNDNSFFKGLILRGNPSFPSPSMKALLCCVLLGLHHLLSPRRQGGSSQQLLLAGT